MDEKYHTWHKNFVYLPVYLTGCSSHVLSDYLFILPKVSNQIAVYTNALIWKPRSSNTYRIASAVSMDVNSGTPRSMAALRIN